MSLGKRLIDRLKQGSEGSVEVSEGELRATADVVGSGPYGSELRGLSVHRAEPRGDGDGARAERMQGAVRRIADGGCLSEPLRALEVDPGSGRGILRTARERVTDREYYEVTVEGGDRVDVGRFRGRESGGRDRIPSNFGHGVLRRLVDELEEVVADRREQVRRGDE
jgi:hypothetical protein